MSVEDQIQAKFMELTDSINTAYESSRLFMGALEDMTSMRPGFFMPGIVNYNPPPISISAIRPGSPDGDVATQITAMNSLNLMPTVPVTFDEVNIPLPDDYLAFIPKPTKDFHEESYVSSLQSTLESRLAAYLGSQGTGLSASVEQDIINRESERNAQAYADARRKLAATWLKSGWDIPDSVLNAQMADLAQKEADRNTDRSREIRIESFKMADENKKFYVQQAIVMESALMQFFNQKADRALRFVIENTAMAASIFKSLVESFIAENEVTLNHTKVLIEIERLNSQKEDRAIMELKTKADMSMSKLRAVIEKLGLMDSIYRTDIMKGEALSRLTVEQQRIVAQNYLASFQESVLAMKANLDASVQAMSIKEHAAVSGGNIYGNYLASMANSITGILSLSSTQQTQTKT